MLQVHLSVELIFSENIDKDDQYKIWQGWEQENEEQHITGNHWKI